MGKFVYIFRSIIVFTVTGEIKMKTIPNTDIKNKLKKLNISLNKSKHKRDFFVVYYDFDSDCFYLTTAMCILSDNIDLCFYVINRFIDLVTVNTNKLMESKLYKMFGFDDYKRKYPNAFVDLVCEKLQNKIMLHYRLLEYLILFKNHLYIEQLIKAGFIDIVVSALDISITEKEFEECFKQGNSIKDITGLDNSIWRLLLKNNITFYSWMIYKRIIANQKINYNQLKKYSDIVGPKHFNNLVYDLEEILNYRINNKQLYTIDSLSRYIDYQKNRNHIRFPDCMEMLSDYIDMSIEMGIKPDLKPQNIRTTHDRFLPLYNDFVVLKNRFKNIRYNKGFLDQKKNLEKYLYENDELKVVIPESPNDLINEGENQHNCVASYIKEHANKKTNILFIRKKNNIDESYITIELDEVNKCILQARYKYNKDVSDPADRAFIDEWLKHCFN